MKNLSNLDRIAAEAGVSRTAVSLVLNSDGQSTRVGSASAQRIRDIAQRLGYVANYHAKSMKTGHAETIAMAFDMQPNRDVVTESATTQLGTPFFGTLVGAIEHCARDHGHLLTIVGPDQQGGAIERGLLGIRQRRFDGLIVFGTPESFRGGAPAGDAAQREPVVGIQPVGSWPPSAVSWDEAAGVDLAIAHVAGHAHRNILWLGPAGSQRESLFIQAAWRAGLHGSSCCFVEPASNSLTVLATAAAEALERHLVGSERSFTAIVAFNEVVGIGACRALQRAGLRVPHDVSILCFDNILAGLASPQLTTVDFRFHAAGQRAAELLFERIRSGDSSQAPAADVRETIQPTLVVRESVGPANVQRPAR